MGVLNLFDKGIIFLLFIKFWDGLYLIVDWVDVGIIIELFVFVLIVIVVKLFVVLVVDLEFELEGFKFDE